MDPQISLEDAFSCFIAGKAMSDVEYKRNQRKIARKVSKSPEYGFRAGKEWDFDRFRPYSFIITEGVSKSSRWSYEAGKEWSDEVFNLDPELIINSIARNSASSYDSFKEMDPSRLQRCASKFLDTVTVLTNKTHDEIIKSKSPLLIAYAVERETGLDFGNQHERLGNVLTLVARLDLGEYEGTGGLAPRKKDRFANSRDILTNYLTGDIKRFEWFETIVY